MTIKYLHFICKGCGNELLPMDMHNKDQCKVCWLKGYNSRSKGRIAKMVETKKLKNKLLLGQN